VGAHQKRPARLTLVRGLFAALALAFVAREAWRYGPELLALQPSPLWVLAASACVLAAFVGQVWAWQWNVARLGGQVAFMPLFRVYYTMNMARYLPGRIWSLAGTVALGARLGLDAGTLTTSVFVGLVSSLVSGVLLGFGMAGMLGFERLLNPWLLVLPGAALVAVIPPVFRYWSRVLWNRLGREGCPKHLETGALLRSVLHYALVWVAYGLACGCLALAVGAEPFGLYVAAFPLAYLVGYAALFAPGGLGVREGALVWLCGGGAAAVAVSLWQRLVLTVLELLLFALSVWRGRHD
jgi:glycosyltransferase 2 family protein